MILSDIGMLIVSSPRSQAYLQMLAGNKLMPSYVIVMDDNVETLGPGQLSVSLNKGVDGLKAQSFDLSETIKDTLIKTDIPFEICPTKDVNSKSVINALSKRKEKFFIYSGIGGAILGKEILGTGKRFLHVHPGRVPDFKGSTTIYYSMLKENRAAASAFFLDRNIDTGDLIKIKEYEKPNDGTLVDYIYDPEIRADLLLDVVKEYTRTGSFKTEKQDHGEGETYFIIHPVLKHIAILSCGGNGNGKH